jgi:hypothetical protein
VELLAYLDILLRDDEDATATIDCLAIRSARMIDIASGVPSWAAIDVPLAIHIENIQIAHGILGWDTLANVLDDRRPLLDINISIQSETSA